MQVHGTQFHRALDRLVDHKVARKIRVCLTLTVLPDDGDGIDLQKLGSEPVAINDPELIPNITQCIHDAFHDHPGLESWNFVLVRVPQDVVVTPIPTADELRQFAEHLNPDPNGGAGAPRTD